MDKVKESPMTLWPAWKKSEMLINTKVNNILSACQEQLHWAVVTGSRPVKKVKCYLKYKTLRCQTFFEFVSQCSVVLFTVMEVWVQVSTWP